MISLRLACLFLTTFSVNGCFANTHFYGLNGLVGKLAHGLFELSGKPSGVLNPAHEELVYSVAQELSMPVGKAWACHESHKMYGPRTIGNDVYLSDEWFEAWKHNPLAQKFVLAHELAHAEHVDSLKRVTFFNATALVSAYLMYKACQYSKISEKADAWSARILPSWIGPAWRANLGKAALVGIGYDIGGLCLLQLARSQEFAADARAFEKLIPHHGRKELETAAADFFLVSPGFEPSARGPLSTHPHSGDRLRALGFSKALSEEAAEKIPQLLKARVQLRFDFFISRSVDVQRQLQTDLEKNWLQIYQAARLCSVHQDVARSTSEALDGATYRDMFARLVDDFMSDPGNKDYRDNYLTDLQRVEEASRSNQQAFVTECSNLVLILQEKM